MEDWQFYVFISIIVVLFTHMHRKLEELARNQHSQHLTSHQILSQLPASVVHIISTPSAASATKEKNLKALLDHLKINFPKPGENVHTSEVYFSQFNFEWDWPAGSTNEISVYAPFCDSFTEFVRSSRRLKLVCAAVGNGQRLTDSLLFSTPLFSLRQYDAFNKKAGKVLYRGEVRGRTDIVIMDEDPPGDIARHNVLFAIEVKKDLKRPGDLNSGLREACTEVLGLCGDNSNSSPPVLLTDFVSVFIVVHLCRVREIPLLFAINADRCSNLKSALSLAYIISQQDCISADFGRPDSPTVSSNDI
jgi:hypothetical protein